MFIPLLVIHRVCVLVRSFLTDLRAASVAPLGGGGGPPRVRPSRVDTLVKVYIFLWLNLQEHSTNDHLEFKAERLRVVMVVGYVAR